MNILTALVLAVSVYLTLLSAFVIGGAMTIYGKVTKSNNAEGAIRGLHLTPIFISAALSWAIFYYLLCL